jgi:hypothetical protein
LFLKLLNVIRMLTKVRLSCRSRALATPRLKSMSASLPAGPGVSRTGPWPAAERRAEERVLDTPGPAGSHLTMDLRAGSLLKKVRLTGLSMAALLAAGSATAAPASGIFSNVCVDSETLDQGGVELQVRLGRPIWATVVICEGGCGARTIESLSLSGDTLSFVGIDRYFDMQGKALPPVRYHYRARLTARRVILTSPDQPMFGRQVLKRQTGRFRSEAEVGLAGDSHVDAWPAPIRRCG